MSVQALADGAPGGVVMIHDGALRSVRDGPAGREARPGTAVVLCTSGTSGPPKAIELPAGKIMGALESLLRLLGATGRSTSKITRRPPNLIAFPLSHLAGLYNLLLALRNHRKALLMRRFAVEEFARLVEERRIPSVILNPTMIFMLAEAAELDPARLASLRFVRSGSAPLSPAVIRRFQERFGVPVLNSYGQTETSGEVIGWKAGDLGFLADKCGSVGRPHPGVVLRFIDEDLRDVPAGEVGELCVQAAFVTSSYLVGDSALAQLEGGFLRTGDLGYVDRDGFVWLVGRRNEVVNCGGFKVLPDEVEDVLRSHHAVLEMMVAGMPDERLGEVPHPFVVPRHGVVGDRPDLETQLREYARHHVAHYKAPAESTSCTTFPATPPASCSGRAPRSLSSTWTGPTSRRSSSTAPGPWSCRVTASGWSLPPGAPRTLRSFCSMVAARHATPGAIPAAASLETKLAVTDTFNDLAHEALDLVGPAALIAHGDPAALAGGPLEHAFRHSQVATIYGGSNEIQRNIIAYRALGLPRR